MFKRVFCSQYYLDLSLHYIKMLSDEEDGKDIATDSDGYLRMPNNGTGDYNTMEDSPTEQKTFLVRKLNQDLFT